MQLQLREGKREFSITATTSQIEKARKHTALWAGGYIIYTELYPVRCCSCECIRIESSEQNLLKR